jgi:hypothetical protein
MVNRTSFGVLTTAVVPVFIRSWHGSSGSFHSPTPRPIARGSICLQERRCSRAAQRRAPRRSCTTARVSGRQSLACHSACSRRTIRSRPRGDRDPLKPVPEHFILNASKACCAPRYGTCKKRHHPGIKHSQFSRRYRAALPAGGRTSNCSWVTCKKLRQRVRSTQRRL